MYYIFIEDNKINGAGQARVLNEEIINFEVTEEVYNSFMKDPNMYAWNGLEIVKNPNYEQEQLAKAKQEKIAENESKRQVEFVNTHLGKLKTETPLGDLKAALPLYTIIAQGNNGLPANSVRLYVNGVPQGSPALTLEEFQELIGEVALDYVKVDQYSTLLTLKINEAKSMKELEKIVIDYDNMPDLSELKL